MSLAVSAHARGGTGMVGWLLTALLVLALWPVGCPAWTGNWWSGWWPPSRKSGH
jgi:hypothetical protein